MLPQKIAAVHIKEVDREVPLRMRLILGKGASYFPKKDYSKALILFGGDGQMFFGFFNKARDNKENILYAIVTIVLLERVRTGWNRLESLGRKKGMAPDDIRWGQWKYLVNASLLYALPFLLPVVKYIFRSIDELSWTVQGLVVLKSTWVFFVVVVLAECFIAIVIFNVLKIYIDRMNTATGFFTKIGRNIWDGSKMAVQVSGDVGGRVVGGIRGLGTGVWKFARKTAGKTRAGVLRAPRSIRRRGLRHIPKFGRRPRRLETPVS
jgi:hypothetical protein